MRTDRAALRCIALAAVLGTAFGAAPAAGAQTPYDLRIRSTAGEKWSFETSQMLVQKLTMTAPSGETKPFEQTLTIRRKGVAEVLAAAEGKPTALKIRFDETSGGVAEGGGERQDLPFPLAAKTITVRSGTGSEITHDHPGTLDPAVIEELKEMLDTHEPYLPGRLVKVGESWRGDPREVARSFQMAEPEGITMECTLKGIRAVGARPAAELALAIAFDRAETGGVMFTGTIRGTILLDLATGRPLQADARGRLEITGAQQIPGPQGDVVEARVAGHMELTNQGAVVPVGAAPGAPVDPTMPPVPEPGEPSAPAAQDFAGNYTGEKVSAELTRAADGSYTGRILRGEQTFPLQARVVEGRLEGTFTHQGHDFPLSAQFEGQTLVLKTGATTYRLTRQAPPALNPLDEPDTPAAPPNPLEGTLDAPPATPARRARGTLRFVRHSVMDTTPQMIGGEASVLLVPVGWNVQSQVVWRQRPAAPAFIVARVSDPASLRQAEFLPNEGFSWGDIFVDNPHFPIGANYLGTVVHPPFQHAAEALRDYVLPQTRGHVDFRLVATRQLPEVARAAEQAAGPVAAGMGRMAFDAARVRIAYQLGDQAVEEDIYCVLNHHEIPAAGNQISQEVHRVVALRAARGELDAATPLLQFVANSPRLNLQWFNRYQQ
ncbi:MAG: hypothetical protein JXQ29_04945, partial [Planctomycetes bacterium]|nr:hypothetical protein [Planctomycetota bacterium]